MEKKKTSQKGTLLDEAAQIKIYGLASIDLLIFNDGYVK